MENAPTHSAAPAQFTVLAARLSTSSWIALVALVVALASTALWWSNHMRLETVERELARRIQAADTLSNESHALAKQSADATLALQGRLGVLESKLAESQSQEASLEQLYQDLSRTRDDWALAEVEQIISVGAQQLQLAGNVQGALTALQNADNRLARADRPQFIPLRRVIARDMERLRSLPSVDVAGNALRLDSLAALVDDLPLLADARLAAPPRLDARPVDRMPEAVTGKDGSKSADARGFWERVQDGWRHAGAEVWQEFQDLVRIREVRQPDALLLSPSQAYFVRENLKLRLLNARLALLARQEPIYRSDLLRAEEILQHYFDTQSRQTVAALALLKQIEASNTAVELPTLSESLTAVRNFKTPTIH